VSKVVSPVAAEAIRIEEADGLDVIHALWMNVGPGQGYATILCYGSAWTVYFGGMSGRTIQEFFASVDPDYLVVKMGITPQLKSGKKYDAYLRRIVLAVQKALRGE
jgi:hypothetical protein